MPFMAWKFGRTNTSPKQERAVEMPSTNLIKPIFIFSLPRSGSTLLQRIIASHPDVATTEEPWLLLPMFGALGFLGTYAEYNHEGASRAITKFAEKLPNGTQDYFDAIQFFACNLYEKSAGNKKFFLDKTPRYHVISAEIMRAFPDAKFVFLIRHPIAIYASVIQTWKYSHIFNYDLYLGFDKLYQSLKSPGTPIHLVRYEELVTSPQPVVQSMCKYLGLDFQNDMLDNFSQIEFPSGALGNPIPQQTNRKQIHNDSRDKWQIFLCENFMRKRLALSYLNYIGEERMTTLGYDYFETQRILDNGIVGLKNLHIDISNIIRGFLSIGLESSMLKKRISSLSRGQRVYAHR